MAAKKNQPAPPPSESEMDRRLRIHRRETVARERRDNLPLLESAAQTAGLPKPWARVLRVAVPVVGGVASNLVAGLHPESPGGRKLTRVELEDLAEEAAADLKASLLREFGGDIA